MFDEEQLAEHARNNIEIDAVYSESNVLAYVAGTFNPGEVFGTRELEAWAEERLRERVAARIRFQPRLSETLRR